MEFVMKSFLGATKKYRSVAGADGVVVFDEETDGAPDRAEEKITARISPLSEFPEAESKSNWDATIWAFAPSIKGLVPPLVSATPGRREVYRSCRLPRHKSLIEAALSLGGQCGGFRHASVSMGVTPP